MPTIPPTDQHALFLLRCHAEVQASACLLLAELVEEETKTHQSITTTLKRLASQFDRAATTAYAETDLPAWDCNRARALQAARLFLHVFDQGLIARYELPAGSPQWDQRGDDRQAALVACLAQIGLSHTTLQKVYLPNDDLRRDVARRPAQAARCKQEPTEGKREFIDSLLDGVLAEVDAYTKDPRRPKAEADELALLSWFSAIRWWFYEIFPERFRADLPQVFHPWVEWLPGNSLDRMAVHAASNIPAPAPLRCLERGSATAAEVSPAVEQPPEASEGAQEANPAIQANARPQSTTSKLTLDARALAVFLENPGLTKKKIAKELRCGEKSLCPERCPRLTAAIEAYKSKIDSSHRQIRGSKDREGNLEAYEDG